MEIIINKWTKIGILLLFNKEKLVYSVASRRPMNLIEDFDRNKREAKEFDAFNVVYVNEETKKYLNGVKINGFDKKSVEKSKNCITSLEDIKKEDLFFENNVKRTNLSGVYLLMNKRIKDYVGESKYVFTRIEKYILDNEKQFDQLYYYPFKYINKDDQKDVRVIESELSYATLKENKMTRLQVTPFTISSHALKQYKFLIDIVDYGGIKPFSMFTKTSKGNIREYYKVIDIINVMDDYLADKGNDISDKSITEKQVQELVDLFLLNKKEKNIIDVFKNIRENYMYNYDKFLPLFKTIGKPFLSSKDSLLY